MHNPSHVRALGWITTFLFIAIAGLHFYWVLGGTWGTDVVFPSDPGEPAQFPGQLASLPVAVGLSICAYITASRSGLIRSPLPMRLLTLGTVLIGLGFLVRAVGEFHYVGFFKTVRGTRFAELDTWLYSPLILLIAILCFLVARSKPAPAE